MDPNYSVKMNVQWESETKVVVVGSITEEFGHYEHECVTRSGVCEDTAGPHTRLAVELAVVARVLHALASATETMGEAIPWADEDGSVP